MHQTVVHNVHRETRYERTGLKNSRGRWIERPVDMGEKVSKMYSFESKSSEPWIDEWYTDSEMVMDYINSGVTYGMICNQHRCNIVDSVDAELTATEKAERAKYL